MRVEVDKIRRRISRNGFKSAVYSSLKLKYRFKLTAA